MTSSDCCGSLNDSIANLSNVINTGFIQVTNRLNLIESRLGVLEDLQTIQAGQIQQLNNDFNNFTTTVDDAFATIENNFEVADRRALTNQNQLIDQLNTEFGFVTSQFATVNASVETIETSIAGIGQNLSETSDNIFRIFNTGLSGIEALVNSTSNFIVGEVDRSFEAISTINEGFWNQVLAILGLQSQGDDNVVNSIDDCIREIQLLKIQIGDNIDLTGEVLVINRDVMNPVLQRLEGVIAAGNRELRNYMEFDVLVAVNDVFQLTSNQTTTLLEGIDNARQLQAADNAVNTAIIISEIGINRDTIIDCCNTLQFLLGGITAAIAGLGVIITQELLAAVAAITAAITAAVSTILGAIGAGEVQDLIFDLLSQIDTLISLLSVLSPNDTLTKSDAIDLLNSQTNTQFQDNLNLHRSTISRLTDEIMKLEDDLVAVLSQAAINNVDIDTNTALLNQLLNASDQSPVIEGMHIIHSWQHGEPDMEVNYSGEGIFGIHEAIKTLLMHVGKISEALTLDTSLVYDGRSRDDWHDGLNDELNLLTGLVDKQATPGSIGGDVNELTGKFLPLVMEVLGSDVSNRYENIRRMDNPEAVVPISQIYDDFVRVKALQLHWTPVDVYPSWKKVIGSIEIPDPIDDLEWSEHFEGLSYTRGKWYGRLNWNATGVRTGGYFASEAEANRVLDIFASLSTRTAVSRTIGFKSDRNHEGEVRVVRAYLLTVEDGKNVCALHYSPPRN